MADGTGTGTGDGGGGDGTGDGNSGTGGGGNTGGGGSGSYYGSGLYGSGVSSVNDHNVSTSLGDQSVQVTSTSTVGFETVSQTLTSAGDTNALSGTSTIENESDGNGGAIETVTITAKSGVSADEDQFFSHDNGTSTETEELGLGTGRRITSTSDSVKAALQATMAVKATGAKGSAAYFASVAASQDPARVAIGATGNTETVYWIQDGFDASGHIAFGVNGSAPIGLYPGGNPSVPGMLEGTTYQGVVQIGADNLPPNNPNATVMAFTFNITQGQATALQFEASQAETQSAQGTLTYNFWTSNCADFVAGANQDAEVTTGLAGAFSSPIPSGEFSYLVGYEYTTNASGSQAVVRFSH